MHVAMVSRGYGKTAGIQRVATDLTESWLARGHRVTFFCADPPPSPGTNASCDARACLDFVAVPVPPRPYALRVPLFALRASAAARAAGPFDIVHGQATDCRGADVVTAHSCHRFGMDLMKRTGGTWERVKKTLNPVHPAIYALERYNFSPAGSRRIISVSGRVKDEIVASYRVEPERIRVVPNGVDLAAFHPAQRTIQRAAIRDRLGVGDDPLVLFVGYEYVRKGLRFLLAALACMRHREARLVVVGKPPTPHARRELARHRLGRRVIFTGPVADVPAYYAAADVFAFPTLYEAFGLVIAEAMASGLPVVTTRVAGAAEWMHAGEDCLLVDAPPDPEELAHHLDRLLDDGNLRRRMGGAARATAERCWGAGVVAEQVLAVYAEVLQERGAAIHVDQTGARD